MFGIFAALAEFERELIRERTVAGLKAARARGRRGGRKFALTKAQGAAGPGRDGAPRHVGVRAVPGCATSSPRARSWVRVRAAHPGPALEAPLRVRARGGSEAPAPAGGHHGRRDHAAEPAPAQARRVSAQNELAAALREVGRITLPVHDRVDHGPRRAPARPGRLEQGRGAPWPSSALSTSTNAANCGDRTGEGQHYRVAGLNLLAAIIIYWNTLKLAPLPQTTRRRATSTGPGPGSATW